MSTWHTIESVHAQWVDGRTIPNDIIEELLETSQDAVLAYARESDFPIQPADDVDDFDDWIRADDTVIKTRWRRAQLLNIQDEWNSEKESSNSDSDAQGFDGVGGTARVYRLSLRAKRLLRPESATEGLIG